MSRPRSSIRGAFALHLAFLCAALAFAADPAVLLRGPYLRRGLDWFPSDLSSYYWGEYGGGIAAEVFLTTDFRLSAEHPESRSWQKRTVARREYLVLPAAASGEGVIVLYRAFEGGRGLFFRFAVREPSAAALSFMPAFEDRLLYLMGLPRDEGVAPFPAVLNPE